MKTLCLCLLISITANASSPAGRQSEKAVQPYTAIVWATITLHSLAGDPAVFLQRNVYTRDASGSITQTTYKRTKGLQRDTKVPVEHVLISSSSAKSLPAGGLSRGVLEREDDLGSAQFFGFPASGKRFTFTDATGLRIQTFERWFSPTLGLTVHLEEHNSRGDSIVSDLSELHVGDALLEPRPAVPPPDSSPIPLLTLYRALFTHVAHMERDRQANDPTLHVNMAEVEANFSKKLGLSAGEWPMLVDTSVRVESYTRDMSKQAHAVADQDRQLRHTNLLSSVSVPGRVTLHKMQMDLNSHVQGAVDELNRSIGQAAAQQVQAYLQGPLASTSSSTPVKLARLQARQAEKGRE